MDFFNYQDGRLYAEDCALEDIAAEYGTPCYVYSRATIERHWNAFDGAFGSQRHLVCYAVKANSNLGVLSVMAALGSGFDIVSVGELERVLTAGGQPNRIVFSGVGKQPSEIERALEVGIRCFNVESTAELDRINSIAGELGIKAPVSLRVNPNVDAKTHPYIATGLRENKFGIDISIAAAEYQRAHAMPHIQLEGVDCHIGSQITEVAPFLDALDRVLGLIDTLDQNGITLHHLDLGGGLGVRYQDETPPLPDAYVSAVIERLGDREIELLIEPGRAIVANAGVLLTKVEYLKPTADRNFAIVDAAMNDLMRPALYQAWQEIVTVEQSPKAEPLVWDIVGPICETGDFLGKGRELRLNADALLAIRSSGAYGFSMASNYNSRPRGAEILIDGSTAHQVRQRESIAELYALESTIDA